MILYVTNRQQAILEQEAFHQWKQVAVSMRAAYSWSEPEKSYFDW